MDSKTSQSTFKKPHVDRTSPPEILIYLEYNDA